jgi:hypothetical protein
MFGNRLGWGISGVLAAFVLLIVYMIARLDTPTAPSQGAINKKGTYSLKLLERPQMLDAIQLPFDPLTVLPTMTQAQDAGPLYRQALTEYAKDKYQYDTRSKFKTTDLGSFPALRPLVDARNNKTMTLFSIKLEEVINYQSIEPEAIKAIGQIGDAATTLSLLLKSEQKPNDALLLAEGAFSLGVKLCQERLRWFEFITGHQLITKSCLLIEQLDPSRAAAAKAAREAMGLFMKERGLPMAYAITSIDPDVMGRTAGDMFYIVKNSRERMWRIEAALKLGHYKWNAGEPGNAADQRWARIVAKRVMNDPNEDEVVRAAAKEAFELTKERYSMIGGT